MVVSRPVVITTRPASVLDDAQRRLFERLAQRARHARLAEPPPATREPELQAILIFEPAGGEIYVR